MLLLLLYHRPCDCGGSSNFPFSVATASKQLFFGAKPYTNLNTERHFTLFDYTHHTIQSMCLAIVPDFRISLCAINIRSCGTRRKARTGTVTVRRLRLEHVMHHPKKISPGESFPPSCCILRNRLTNSLPTIGCTSPIWKHTLPGLRAQRTYLVCGSRSEFNIEKVLRALHKLNTLRHQCTCPGIYVMVLRHFNINLSSQRLRTSTSQINR
jgi:hypothetical protein